MVDEIKAEEEAEIKYTKKYEDSRRQIQLSNLGDIIKDLIECQNSIDSLNIQKNFIPKYLDRGAGSNRYFGKYLKHEKNLRRRSKRCSTALHPALMEIQRS